MTRNNMLRNDMKWYNDIIKIWYVWYEMRWVELIWYDITWFHVKKKWCDMIRYKNWYDWIWYDMKRLYDLMRF